MARVVTVTAAALAWCFLQHFRAFLFPWQGLAKGCQQMIQVTLQRGFCQSQAWPAAVTFGQGSLGPGGARGACLPAELRGPPGPATTRNKGGPRPNTGSVWGDVLSRTSFVLSVWFRVSSWMLVPNKSHLFSHQLQQG